MERGEAMVIVDLRSDLSYHDGDGGKVPGAICIPPEDFEQRYMEIPRDRPVVMYCNCPNEATSARMARLLIEKGYLEVWPLQGGFDGWVDLGYPTEPVASPLPVLTSIVAAVSSA